MRWVPMTRRSRASRTRITRPMGVPIPPMMLAATNMAMTGTWASVTAMARPSEAAKDPREALGVADRFGQPAAPVELCTDHVRGRGHQDGEGDDCGDHQSGGEKIHRPRPCQGPQGLSGVLGRGYALMMPFERCRRGDEHEPQDDGGEHGTDDRPEPGSGQAPAVWGIAGEFFHPVPTVSHTYT